MSSKRKLDEESDPESDPEPQTSSGNKSGKRKSEDVCVDDFERNEVKRFEEKYSNRYTEEDPEYKQCLERPDIGPPILTNYFGKREFRGNDRRRGYGQRSGWGERRDHWPRQGYQSWRTNDNRRSDWSERPYNRY